ncbi:hypothetical protein BpHYR1_032535 [Brachionus plicatilis]|uniref:Uncharacterized protein n=1 Tax=Brachionus plicatilis TaxID=10195 RepID=A0A3M7P4R7_BRAPC|nr:hypothetical protein BpHYR1_032535 [Brachionus plicatilis]
MSFCGANGKRTAWPTRPDCLAPLIGREGWMGRALNFEDSKIDFKNKLISNEARSLNYELRNKEFLFEPDIKSKHGTKTFEYLYSKLINKFFYFLFIINSKLMFYQSNLAAHREKSQNLYC